MVYPDFTKGSKEVDLGDAASFTELPATVVIDDYEFFLAQSKEGNYKLLSSLCPHSWGTIFHEDNCFMCPTHGWRFEVSEGICVNGPNANMYSFEVAARDGHLFATLPDKKG